MKNQIFSALFVLVIQLLVATTAPSQGTVYVSNLGQASASSLAVGSDSWRAATFVTGTNAGGYALNSVQLLLTGVSGSPAGFSVFVYANAGLSGPIPGNSLGSLNGSTDPSSGGIFIYTAASTITLMQNSLYYIVVTGGTSVANGAYGWSLASGIPPKVNDWRMSPFTFQSNNGLLGSWIYTGNNYLQYAVSATAVPEPSTLALAGLGTLLLAARRRLL